MAKVVVIAGMSGAGRSVAAEALEDQGWFVIDNLPAELISTISNLALLAGDDYQKMALVIGGYDERMSEQVDRLEVSIDDFTLLFLEASPETLISRFKATKRPHHLANDQSLADAIAQERKDLESARAKADLVIDTSRTNPYELKERVISSLAETDSETTMQINLLSFGFKNGVPRDVDMIFDVRFMPNPHWVPELKPKTGREQIIQDYVLTPEVSQKFMTQLKEMLGTLLPAFKAEGKSYLVVGIGCTGGKHRSVAVSEQLAAHLTEDNWENSLRHRDIDK